MSSKFRPVLSIGLIIVQVAVSFLTAVPVAGSTPMPPAAPLTAVLPAWATSASADPLAEVMPRWFEVAQPPTLIGKPAAAPSSILPAWFDNPATVELPEPVIEPPICPINPSLAQHNAASSAPDHHTIHDSAVAVSGPAAINNCDVVTFTVVAQNDAFTTTNVVITSTMPAGFEPRQRVFTQTLVAPNEVITLPAVFTAGCDAVSGQNVVTLTQEGGPTIPKYTDFVVNPGAITLRKDPSVIPAAVGDVVTWTVIVENTGYGRVDNVVVTDTLGSGLSFVNGQLTDAFDSIPVGETRTFTVAAEVVACTGLDNGVEAMGLPRCDLLPDAYSPGQHRPAVEHPLPRLHPPDL